MLLVLFPFASVLGAIQMAVGAVPMCFIVLPVPIVNVSIRMYQSSFSIRFVVSPVALVERAIGPNLDTLSLTGGRANEPLAKIRRSVLHGEQLPLLTLAKLGLEL